jgi:hypothetical protein
MNAMNTIKTTGQCIDMIAISQMEPESGYQRPTNTVQVDNIVRKFNEAKLGVLTVSDRDGKFHLIDGAHRAKALRRLGYTHAPCIVLKDLTFIDEANLFRFQGKDRRLITPLAFFKAGLNAGDGQCVLIDNTARANGFHIGNGAKEFFKITAVRTLFKIVDDYGCDILNDTLCLLAKTWSKFPKASQSASLLGVAEFVNRHGMVDFPDRMRDKFAAVLYDYSDAVRDSSIVSSRVFCCVLEHHYNRGLAPNSVKRLRWGHQK